MNLGVGKMMVWCVAVARGGPLRERKSIPTTACACAVPAVSLYQSERARGVSSVCERYPVKKKIPTVVQE